VLVLIFWKEDHLTSSCFDKTINIWNYRTGFVLKTLQGHSGNIYCLAHFSNEYLASASTDQSLKIWHLTVIYDYPKFWMPIAGSGH